MDFLDKLELFFGLAAILFVQAILIGKFVSLSLKKHGIAVSMSEESAKEAKQYAQEARWMAIEAHWIASRAEAKIDTHMRMP